MNEPPPRSASLPLPYFSSLDPRSQELTSLRGTHVSQHYPDLWNPIHETLLSQDSEIHTLKVHLEDQIALTSKLNDEITSLKVEKEEKERDLEQSKGVNKEQRVQIGKQKVEFKEKEAELAECWRQKEELEVVIGVLNPKVSTLEKEKRDSEGTWSANRISLEKKIEDLELELKGFKDRVPDVLGERVERLEQTIEDLKVDNQGLREKGLLLERKAKGLNLEVGELREAKSKRDAELDTLQKEKKTFGAGKAKLARERDEANKREESLLIKIQGLEAVRQKLGEKLEEQDGTIESRQREVESLESYNRRLKNEREDFTDNSNKVQREKATLEQENNKLKRKINNIKAECSSDDANEEPPTKRPRTPQIAKRDSIPQGPRAMAGGSPDIPRSMSMSSPNDGRHRRFSGNEVRRVDVSLQNLYSSRW
jgi:chromosome segregation ATPase